ncbi:hypothetical protein L1987_15972 [Smallanthus sonchifolius]|uniref:Uncharacterized protein n=1 Tax=Smallanthus sonchifolius TaxID=185202 RepID=A0ACB9J6Y9_9ASTR|nr:hypothetical protein L1987_15972 [Smallanthus sonchifolius]
MYKFDATIVDVDTGVDNPDWINEFLIENLSGRRAILRIKIDSYNLAPNFVRQVTVSKFLGDDISMVEKNKNTSNVGVSLVLATYAIDYAANRQHWMWLYNQVDLHAQRPKKSVSAYDIDGVAPICYANLAATLITQFMMLEDHFEASYGVTSTGAMPIPQLPKL